LERNEKAFSIIEKAVINSPNDEYLQSSMAFILYKLGKTDEAKLYYTNALQINANLTSILSDKELIVFDKLMNNITKQ